MSGFFDGSQIQIPYPPPDIPTPSIPAADFAAIGQQLEAGKQAAAKADTSPPFWLKWISWIVSITLGTALNCLLKIVTKLLQLVLQFFNTGDANMNALAAAALSGMLGVPDGSGKIPSAVQAGKSDSVSANLANILQSGLEKGAARGANGMLTPSSQGANNFLAMSAHLAVEGWLQGIIVEISSANYLERFGDLKDTLENAFGMGRLARRALAAPMKILVEDPYTWKLNQTYLPTLLSPGELVSQYLRDPTQKDNYYAQMALHGYTPDKAETIVNLNKKHLSLDEIVDLLVHKTIQFTDAETALKAQGYDELTADYIIQVATRKRTEAWERRGLEEALGLYRQHHIDRPTYDSLVSKALLPADEQFFYSRMADLMDFGHQQFLTIAEGETLVKKGIWEMTDFAQLMTHYGYSAADQISLEQLLFGEIATAQQAALDKAARQAAALARQQAAAARAAERARIAAMEVESKGVSTAQYENLVYEGLRTPADYYQYLINKQVAADNAAALTQALGVTLLTKAAAAAKKAAAAGQAKQKNLDITQLETAVKQGLLTLPDFTARLKGLGMSEADAQLLTQELSDQMTAATTKAQATAAAKAAAAVKHVDTTQEERAVLLGTQTIQQYAAFLDAHNFTPEDRDVLVNELQARLTAAQATAATKAAAAKKAATQGINLTQLERLVRAGIKTVADYQAALANLGYSASDQQAMVQYLQLQMEQDQQDLITKGHAADLVGQLGVSLTDLERAVKLSVVPIATYQDALQRAGVPAADQQTMVATLAAQIKTTRTQQTTASTVSKQVAAAGVSLTSLEADVKSGKLSMEQFQALLAGYGVPADQITDVVALVQDMIDNAKAVQALVADATVKAAAKGLNLSQDTAAYKQGVMDEATWRARVASLGYDAADVEILFETLAATQAAAAAKSAAKSTTTTAAPPAAPTSPAAGG